jgi:hypothetical protein
MNSHVAREPRVDPAAVDAVLTASQSVVAVATRSLGAAAEETTIAQYRALVVLASRARSDGGPGRGAGRGTVDRGADVRPVGAQGPSAQAPGAAMTAARL